MQRTKRFTILKLLMFVYIPIFSYAQTKTSVKGQLIYANDQKPIEMATVAMVSAADSSLITYAITDKNGLFFLHELPINKDLKLIASFFAYEKVKIDVKLNKGETKDLGMIALRSKVLKEILIKADRDPVSVRKDTIEFDAEAFKVRPNAVVEDLLKKMPGLQIFADGRIMFNGTAVNKIKVNNRDFFQDNITIATKNLDAELISKVQIYDDRDNDPNHIIPSANVGKIINLKFKTQFLKSIVGRGFGGTGTNKRYEAGGMVNVFRDTLQLSIVGISNNLNQTGFDRQDLNSLGGFSRGGEFAISSGNVPTAGNVPLGQQRLTSTGFNLNTDYGNKLKVNVLYFYNDKAYDLQQESLMQNFFSDTILTTKSSSFGNTLTKKHYLSGQLQWKPNNSVQVRYSPELSSQKMVSMSNSMSDRSNTYIPLISSQTNTHNGLRNSINFNHSLSFNKKMKKKGTSFTITNNLTINNSAEDIFNTSILDYLLPGQPNDIKQFRLRDISKGLFSTNTNVSFRTPISKKITLDLQASSGMENRKDNLSLFDRDPQFDVYSNLLTDQSGDLSRTIFRNQVKPSVTYQATKSLAITAGANLLWQNITKKFHGKRSDLVNDHYYVLPNVSLSYKTLSISYDANVNQPDLSDLRPNFVENNTLATYRGNPYLVPTINHRVQSRYFSYFPKSQISLSFSASLGSEENSIINMSSVDAQGRSFVSPINVNGRRNASVSGNFNKQYRKTDDWQIGENHNISFNYLRIPTFNNTPGFLNVNIVNVSQSVNINWKDKIEIAPSYNITSFSSRYNSAQYLKNDYFNHEINTKLTIFLSKRIVSYFDHSFLRTTQIVDESKKTVNLLNSSLSFYLFKKSNGEIKLAVYDLLNQNIGVSSSATGFTTEQQNTQLMKRYFLVSLIYKFNKAQNK